MSVFEPISTLRRPGEIEPRTPWREITDLLATALLRLRQQNVACTNPENISPERAVQLGFSGHQSVHDNPSEPFGERK